MGMFTMPPAYCTRCGMSLQRAFAFAALIEVGAQTNVDPLQCEDASGRKADHDFKPLPKKD